MENHVSVDSKGVHVNGATISRVSKFATSFSNENFLKTLVTLTFVADSIDIEYPPKIGGENDGT